MKSSLGPLTFAPILVPKPWGGRRLALLGKDLPDQQAYGESWEIADLPPESVTSASLTRTVIEDGPHAGLAPRALVTRWGEALLGTASPTVSGDFPLLVKYLDARQSLSVQVHPDAGYVARHRGTHLKTESWFVVDAHPEAVLYLGFREGVELAEVEARIGQPGMVELMNSIPVRPGDFHHLPAGTIHALGAGVVVAEIQTPSDTTFRLYDWTEEYERVPRDLHLEEGLEALRLDATPRSFPPLVGDGRRLLVETAHYSVVEHSSSAGTVELHDSQELRILMVVGGEVIVSVDDAGPLRLAAGRTVLVPALTIPTVRIDVSAPSTVLEIGLVRLASH